MGIDYYFCDRCGDSIPVVIDYVGCSCGYTWCSDICAKKDGYDDGFQLDEDGNEIYKDSTCNYCRGDDFDNEELLRYSLELLKITREQLVVKLKNSK